ncbi:SDR family oxidoreductase [Phenylobacterium sp.]|uniref:SDR family oxidoreductase n=1 Tax=Phenylobacterium sp. TaxID=1871053 RepID=UPI0035B20A3C
MSELFSVSGKVALVTGGSRGIGAMIARGLVEAGARVYISSRDEAACTAMAAELGGPDHCRALPADLSKVSEIERIAEAFGRQEDALNILVNNAGAVWGASLESFPEAGFDKIMALNLKSAFFTVQKLLPFLRKAAQNDDPARIINIGSVEGLHVPTTDTFSYSASKAGVQHLTRHLAARLGREDITANAIAPGPFPTRMTANMPEFDEIVAGQVPLRRAGRPDDIVGTVLYLSSRAGAYVNAVTLPLDGGWTGAL